VIDTNVLKLVQPGTFSDLLTDVLRSGAHALLAQAVEAEVASFLVVAKARSPPGTCLLWVLAVRKLQRSRHT